MTQRGEGTEGGPAEQDLEPGLCGHVPLSTSSSRPVLGGGHLVPWAVSPPLAHTRILLFCPLSHPTPQEPQDAGHPKAVSWQVSHLVSPQFLPPSRLPMRVPPQARHREGQPRAGHPRSLNSDLRADLGVQAGCWAAARSSETRERRSSQTRKRALLPMCCGAECDIPTRSSLADWDRGVRV